MRCSRPVVLASAMRSSRLSACLLLVLACGDDAAADALPSPAVQPSNRAATMDPQPALDLLAKYVESVKAAAADGNDDGSVTLTMLDELSAQADAKRSAGTIDAQFHLRFARLINVTKLPFEPRTEASRARIQAELSAFVREVEGTPRPIAKGGLGEIASTLSKEVINLHLLVDDGPTRKELQRKYFDG